MNALPKNTMRKLGTTAVIFSGVYSFFVGPSLSTEIVKDVHFKSGSISSTLIGTVNGCDTIKYKLEANAGQAMSILFSPKHPSCYFNVIPPGALAAEHRGEIDGNEFTANLKSSGVYTAEIYLMRSAARRNDTCKYSITFEISG